MRKKQVKIALFCGRFRNYNLEEPWIERGYWYATDGRILVRKATRRKVYKKASQKTPRVAEFFTEWPSAAEWKHASRWTDRSYGGIGVLLGRVLLSTIDYRQIAAYSPNICWLPRDFETIWFDAPDGLQGVVLGRKCDG